jgi:hypothetical protein
MKGKKFLFLFLALLLPIAVFVFLKFFGKNRFEVPLIYKDGVSDPPAACLFDYPKPYLIPDSILAVAGANNSSIVILDFSRQPSTEMQVVRDEFDHDPVVIKSASTLNFADEKLLRECIFLMKEPNELVMIDSEKRIRGYYENTREEIDRLILELKILLKKY